GEQDEPDAGRGQREPAADPGEDGDGLAARDPFDEHDLGAFADGQLDVLAGDLGQVFQVRESGLAQAETARGQRADLPQAQADVVAAGGVAFEGAPGRQLGDQPVDGGDGQPRLAGQLAEGERGLVGGERG